MPHSPHIPNMQIMTPTAFAGLGLPTLAFVKPVTVEGEFMWSIHSADGTQIGLAPSREIAFAAMIQNELDPVSVH